ncbi:hypothetical protein GCM10010172_32170 [Paractinoplanes ferrugineus]|uniref:DUF4240 domain-containing protein n=1 Tax=Paractinoplanes ferrugineus TaxID=113564 RepID=A0A919JBH2_9ACTN|nr:DUF4240 domain-containing protein [Actinoplanes ferrugineus]GIE14091.1 hypothetical protein Afe05nite_59310 [Actinoplanes ferrugineus]
MKAIADEPGRAPTAAEEDWFWQLIEAAWERLGEEPAALRRELLARDYEEEASYAIEEWLDPFLDALRDSCEELSRTQLTDLDRVLERKLYDLDREDIQEVTDGSDDGFLYCRGFIVALGRAFYEEVRAEPRVAMVDAECESMCYFFADLHAKQFGDYPRTGSGISRETASNPAGWTT